MASSDIIIAVPESSASERDAALAAADAARDAGNHDEALAV